MTRRIGFTGSRYGMSAKQREACRQRLVELGAGEFHHGDCVGADAEAAAIARELGYEIHCHPPRNRHHRAFTAHDKLYEEKYFLDRDQDIVDACDELIAAPAQQTEVVRSGTWATVRRARKAGKPVTLVLR